MTVTQKVCKVGNCESSYGIKVGYCNKHYIQMRRHGSINDNTIRTPRPAVLKNGQWLIPLGVAAKDGYAIIDEEDKHLDKYFWYVSEGYVVSRSTGVTRRLHRVITNAPPKTHVDHTKHNPLDNRKSKLRICTSSQNVANSKVSVNSTTGYKGVFKNGSNTFMACIVKDRKRIYIGNFKTALEASRAYDKKAVELFGEYAFTNQAMTHFEE